MTDQLNVAIVGAGGIAQSYAQALEAHPDARLSAVCDTHAPAASALAQRHKAAAFDSLDALLSHAPDAVVICTPPDTHEDLVTRCLRRGLPTLCEKPFTLTPTSARRMAREARDAGVLLTMASKFRYVDDVTLAKQVVSAGLVGEIILFENAFTARVDMSRRWNARPEVSGGGVLIDNGTHSVDLMRYFLGPLAEVHAVEGKRVQGLVVEDTARLFVRSAAGVMGSVDLSWSINKELDWYISVYGSLGTVQVGWKQSRFRQAGAADWVVFGRGYQKVEAFRAQLSNFARAARGHESLRITCDDAIASVDVIDAAYRSLKSAPWTGTAPDACDLTRTPLPAAPTRSAEVARA